MIYKPEYLFSGDLINSCQNLKTLMFFGKIAIGANDFFWDSNLTKTRIDYSPNIVLTKTILINFLFPTV